jgi:hypothetical protein
VTGKETDDDEEVLIEIKGQMRRRLINVANRYLVCDIGHISTRSVRNVSQWSYTDTPGLYS